MELNLNTIYSTVRNLSFEKVKDFAIINQNAVITTLALTAITAFVITKACCCKGKKRDFKIGRPNEVKHVRGYSKKDDGSASDSGSSQASGSGSGSGSVEKHESGSKSVHEKEKDEESDSANKEEQKEKSKWSDSDSSHASGSGSGSGSKSVEGESDEQTGSTVEQGSRSIEQSKSEGESGSIQKEEKKEKSKSSDSDSSHASGSGSRSSSKSVEGESGEQTGSTKVNIKEEESGLETPTKQVDSRTLIKVAPHSKQEGEDTTILNIDSKKSPMDQLLGVRKKRNSV